MAVVFLAEDPYLERPVALKIMGRGLAGVPEARQRFLREAKATAKIKNDHVVAIY
jgi:serine/threonine protein kinase